MLTHLRPALVLTLVFTLLTGLAYPLLTTAIAITEAALAAMPSMWTRT